MAFSTQTRVLMVLGYSLVSINNRAIVLPALDGDAILYVESILVRLLNLDQDLETNIRDSMAVKVQDLGLDYGAYVAQARAQGSRLLKELAAATGTPVVYDRYRGSSGNSITVRNYY